MKGISGDKATLKKLLSKGVNIPSPEGVEIGFDINLDRISGEGVTIHAGCRIYGEKTLIMPGAELGYEGPVTVHNCQIGKDVKLNGGFFYDSCFFEGVNVGSGAQVREACLLEEGARCAHTVGLKQTIIFPFVTLGSLINFCDTLMGGGTDEKNHSEVGSSYIHFNYTPNQDKAAPSLIGDVPLGVMINQPPIFLGGQGGLVGPVRIAFGTVVAAGTIVRKDLLKEKSILLGHRSIPKSMPFHQGLYSNIKRIISLNTIFISNLIALRTWYLEVRSRFMGGNPMEMALLEGAIEKVDKAIRERLKRFGEVARRMPQSIEVYQKIASERGSKGIIQRKREFFERWADIEQAFKEGLSYMGNPEQQETFLEILEEGITRKGKDYLMAIKGLPEDGPRIGTAWLQGIVDSISSSIWETLPSFKIK